MLISRTTLPATLSSIFRSLIDYQDETVKAGTPGEEERSGYDQHPLSKRFRLL